MSGTRGLAVLATFAFLLLAAGCDCTGPAPAECEIDDDCDGEALCRDGTCVDPTDAGPPLGDDAGPPFDAGPRPDAGPGCTPACGADETCVGSVCVTNGPECAGAAECQDDQRCDPTTGRCRPFMDGETDPECNRLIVAGNFTPTVQCEFLEAPADDAFPAHVHVLATPMVADFAIGRGPDQPPRPSIIAVFDDGSDGSSELPTGVIRILDGATCAQQAELGSLQLTSHSSPPAIGDLDGDGRPEIVANQGGGGLVAFTYDSAASAWTVLWRSTTDGSTPYSVSGSGWAGPSLYDLDDDGVPEVLRGGIVLDANGVLLDGASLGLAGYSQGVFGVVANVDDDPAAEWVGGDGVWEWSGGTWVAEAYATGGTARGHVALGDFGNFPGGAAWPSEAPEVAVVTSSTVRVQTLDGTIVFGPVAIPLGGTGGPPTVGDFDGDGRPEVASAGGSAYSVFDLDCGATPVGACASGSTNGVLWTQPSQDGSSNVTGSSIFDFEGDGRAEAVYGDECFLRVYDGESGEVLFSQSRSSCTWYENPVVADLDGDFNAEIVIGNNFNCGSATTGINCAGFGLGPRNTDPIFAGLRCSEATDCLSGDCSDGFCRCTTDEQCCQGAGCDVAGFVCEPAPAGTPGTGNTCRAARPQGNFGIRVYRDAADRWVSSRRIWNQHAYHVTNVDEAGTVPRTSLAARNWATPGLNNFRQNVQGDLDPDAAPDLTSGGEDILDCNSDGTGTLTARVCNRGTEPVGSDIVVGFYTGDPAAGGVRICGSMTAGVLDPGMCEAVTCTWADPPSSSNPVEVWVVPDEDNATGECEEENNVARFDMVGCTIID